MKNMIMFVTYDFSDLSSGSKIRPQKMYEAFNNLGYNVFLIAGNKSQKKEGLEQLKKENTIFNFCYVEPSSYPMQPLIDYEIIRYIKNCDIPIGIFYRDAYWKFYKTFVYRGYKNFELKIRYHLDLLFFKKNSDIMFFPSDEMSKYFKFKQPKISLPPAVDKKLISWSIQQNYKIPTAIYVGGISKRYGTELLLKSFARFNQNSIKVKLLFVCREEEYKNNLDLFDKYKDSTWLEVKHAVGKQLKKLYTKANFGVIPLLKDLYNDFAVPVKLFEYLSYGLPILTTNCSVLMDYVNENKLGLVKEDNTDSFSEGIQEMAQCYNSFENNIYTFITKKGTWEHRALVVEESF